MNLEIKNKRINWIDVAKGFGIFLIVLGHVLKTGILRKYIFAFHVPLFFILSGLTLNANVSFKQFVIKKFKTLMIPYYVFSLISIAIYNIMTKLVPTLGNSEGLLTQLAIVIYGNSRPDIMKWNTPLWFLPCLFIVIVFAFLLERVAISTHGRGGNKNYIRIIFTIVSFFIGLLIQTSFNIRLPMQFECGFLMIGFTEIGCIIRDLNINLKIERTNRFKLIVYGLTFLITGFVLSNVNGFAEVRIYQYGKFPILFIITALVLSSSFIVFSFIFSNSKMWRYIGMNTMVILLLHKFPIIFFQYICPIIKTILSKSSTLIGTIVSIIISLIVILMCIIAGKLIALVCPEVIGKINKSCKSL